MDRNYEVITIFQNPLISNRPGVVIFVNIIKIAIIFIKEESRLPKKVQRIRNYALKSNFYLYFLVKKMLLSAELKGCVT